MILGIIQARMGSRRVPGKVLKTILEKPLLYYMIKRLKYSKLLDNTVIAVGKNENNRPIINFCKKNNIDFYIGSEDDVLDRFYKAAKKFKGDTIVRFTGDSPLIDPLIVDNTIQFYLDNKNSLDYAVNGIEFTFPWGLGIEVFSFEVLETMHMEANKEYYKEHVTTFINDNSQRFNIGILKNSVNLSHLWWAVDFKEDFELISKLIHELYPKNKLFLMEDILRLLKKKPELEKINCDIKRNVKINKKIKIKMRKVL